MASTHIRVARGRTLILIELGFTSPKGLEHLTVSAQKERISAETAIRKMITMTVAWMTEYFDDPDAAILYLDVDGLELQFLRMRFTNLPICEPRTRFSGFLLQHVLENLEMNLIGPAWGVFDDRADQANS